MLTRPIRRTIPALPILWATVALTLAPLPTARASFIQISGPPPPAGSLTFTSSGQLSGTIPIDISGPANGPTGPADLTQPTFSITNGLLSFNLGRPENSDISQGYNFGGSGSITLTGSFDGGPQETILSSPRDLNGGFMDNLGPGGSGSRWGFFLGSIGYIGIFAGDIRAPYGLPLALVGEFYVSFTGTPGGANGGVDAGAVVTVGFDTVPAAVAEPGSAGMVGMGGGLVVVVGRVVRKSRRFF
jgi:hypothetical protein